MGFLSKIFGTEKDEYLDELQRKPIEYQHFFEQIEKVADAKIWARFILSSKFALSEEGLKQIGEEEKKTEQIFKKAIENNLNQVVLLVVYLQYATADPLFDQNARKSHWVSVVRNRKSIDSFPDHNAIINYLKQCGYIGE